MCRAESVAKCASGTVVTAKGELFLAPYNLTL